MKPKWPNLDHRRITPPPSIKFASTQRYKWLEKRPCESVCSRTHNNGTIAPAIRLIKTALCLLFLIRIKTRQFRGFRLPTQSGTMTKKSSLCEKKNAVYYIQISQFSFQRNSSFWMCKLAQWWRHTLNRIFINYDEKKISQPICIRNVWFFAVRLYLICSTIWEKQPRYHGNILGSRPPQN